jgi:hypothetical protein
VHQLFGYGRRAYERVCESPEALVILEIQPLIRTLVSSANTRDDARFFGCKRVIDLRATYFAARQWLLSPKKTGPSRPRKQVNWRTV